MNRTRLTACLTSAALIAVSSAIAQSPQPPQFPKDPAKPAPAATPPKTPAKPEAAKPGTHTPPAMQLPPGMTEADMQACAEAATTGPMHEFLAQGVGTWQGKNKTWMTREMKEPVTSECVSTVTSMMDGRFTKVEVAGEMPGMGPFNGFGIYGYDNVSRKFVGSWIDNCGTGIMQGTGELSSDKQTLTINYTYNCPIRKKPAVMREVQKRTGPDSMVMEMHITDPKSEKEYKMGEITFTRKPGTGPAANKPTTAVPAVEK